MQKRPSPGIGSNGTGVIPNGISSIYAPDQLITPGYVRTIRELIFYEYARVISMNTPKGGIDHALISNRFKALMNKRITISGTNREWRQEQNLPIECIFCGAKDDLQIDHLIPLNRGGSDSSENSFLSCPSCIISRNHRSLFQWLGIDGKDRLHRLVMGSYLKQLFDLHTRKGSLEIHKNALVLLCPLCMNETTCREWNTHEELTCLCLESAFY